MIVKLFCIALIALSLTTNLYGQSRGAGRDKNEIKKYVNNKDTIGLVFHDSNIEAVKSVLVKYNNAIEKLDATGTEQLFTTNSKVYESGGSEGNYQHYLEHHLNPELKEFTAFTFNDYNVEVQVAGNYAFATETYLYKIIVAKDKSEVRRRGIATSVLIKIKGVWKIMISHNSSRKG